VTTKQRKILIVDDNPDVVEITREELLACNYEVITASNGLEGLNKAEREDPDLVILDIMLPGIDGYEVCHRLRSKPRTAELPILMYSAKVRESDREMGLRMGANDYVAKSLDSAPDLVRRVEVLLAKKVEKEAAALAEAEAAAETEVGAEVEAVSETEPVSETETEVGAEVEVEAEAEAQVGASAEEHVEPQPSDEVEEEDIDEERRRSRLSPRPRL
jgi:DNA-binding response OmpR family regulator